MILTIYPVSCIVIKPCMLPLHHLLMTIRNDKNAVKSHDVLSCDRWRYTFGIPQPVRRLACRIYVQSIWCRIFSLDTTMSPWKTSAAGTPHHPIATTLKQRMQQAKQDLPCAKTGRCLQLWTMMLPLWKMMACSCSCPLLLPLWPLLKTFQPPLTSWIPDPYFITVTCVVPLTTVTYGAEYLDCLTPCRKLIFHWPHLGKTNTSATAVGPCRSNILQ
jgi:hypothetical protein